VSVQLESCDVVCTGSKTWRPHWWPYSLSHKLLVME